jgi:glyoxylase-like metal-dependent hydrolase (beta-lactamase superfamily II)
MGAVTGWQEVADRVWVRRYDPYDVNVTVIAGQRHVLLVDVRTTLREAAELRDHIAELPVGPVSLVAFTHAHLDHCLGAGVFAGVPVWGTAGCRDALLALGPGHLASMPSWVPEEEHAHLRASHIIAPDHTFRDRQRLGLGDREVELLHLGHGHTDHDLVVHVPDAEVMVAGDLVEIGAPPQFGDAYPYQWPSTLAAFEAFDATVVVPGHGAVTDQAGVARQQADLAQLASLCREVHGGIRRRASALERSQFPPATTEVALGRAADTRP